MKLALSVEQGMAVGEAKDPVLDQAKDQDTPPALSSDLPRPGHVSANISHSDLFTYR